MGLIRDARSAGTRVAAQATRTTIRTTKTNVPGSLAPTPPPSCQPQRLADGGEFRSLAENQCQHVAGLSTEGGANANVPRGLFHLVRDHAVHTNHGKNQCKQRKRLQ